MDIAAPERTNGEQAGILFLASCGQDAVTKFDWSVLYCYTTKNVGVTMSSKKLLRDKQVIEMLSISRSNWWRGVREGRYPQPIKLGPRTTCWRESDILKLIEDRSE
jgi:prophage regulatory protein